MLRNRWDISISKKSGVLRDLEIFKRVLEIAKRVLEIDFFGPIFLNLGHNNYNIVNCISIIYFNILCIVFMIITTFRTTRYKRSHIYPNVRFATVRG